MLSFHFSQAFEVMMVPLLCALGAGALIGLERSAGGRAAGFRTFTLVALGSALLTVPAVHPELWHYLVPTSLPPMDPTRVIQGIVTGVGFLGAGVIYKEGYNIRGLTTAACIWVVSAIGVMMGLGLFDVGAAVTAMVLAVLTVFRHVEAIVPTRLYSHLSLSYRRDDMPGEIALRAYLRSFNFKLRDFGYRLNSTTGLFEYKVKLISENRSGIQALVEDLRSSKQVAEFQLTQASE